MAAETHAIQWNGIGGDYMSRRGALNGYLPSRVAID